MNSMQDSTKSEDEKKDSRTTILNKKKETCKEIGQILSRVGDQFEQRFSSRHVDARAASKNPRWTIETTPMD